MSDSLKAAFVDPPPFGSPFRVRRVTAEFVGSHFGDRRVTDGEIAEFVGSHFGDRLVIDGEIAEIPASHFGDRRVIAGKTAAVYRISAKEILYAYVVKVDLPGLRMEEVNIQARDGKVVISTTINEIMESLARESGSPTYVLTGVEDGKQRGEEEGETDTGYELAFTHHCCDGSEYNNDKFHLEFSLPENAKVEQVKASMENGVLTVTIPKEKVQFPFICDVIEEATIRDDTEFPFIRDIEEATICDDIEEAFTLMNKMSAINHTLWTRVSQQARQIEHLYEQAIEAKMAIELGNKELAQAIKRNSCGTAFLLILLLLLAFCLLF